MTDHGLADGTALTLLTRLGLIDEDVVNAEESDQNIIKTPADTVASKKGAVWSVDEILRDPHGYQATADSSIDRAAAEWVAREVQRRLEVRQERRRSLGRWLMDHLGLRDPV